MEKLTDTHTHLYAKEFENDLPALLQQANALGVERFFMPNIDNHSIAGMLELEKTYPGKCFPMMGLHPCSVKENRKSEMLIVEEWLAKRKFAAVGEMGIDLFWDKTFLEEQKMAFIQQVELANQYKLPIVIHTRDSFDVVIDLLKSTRKEAPAGIFHCFTGTLEEAQKAIEFNFLIGVGGVVTFKNGGLDKVLPHLDLKHIVLETDAPYLAPVPYRGKRNEPVYLQIIAQKVADMMQISVENVIEQTGVNAKNL